MKARAWVSSSGRLNVLSNSEGFRTIEQGGLLVNDEKITDKKQQVTLDMFKDDALLIKKGKKKFHRVVVK